MTKTERRRIKNRVRDARAKHLRAVERVKRAADKMRVAEDEWADALSELAALDHEDRAEIMSEESDSRRWMPGRAA